MTEAPRVYTCEAPGPAQPRRTAPGPIERLAAAGRLDALDVRAALEIRAAVVDVATACRATVDFAAVRVDTSRRLPNGPPGASGEDALARRRFAVWRAALLAGGQPVAEILEVVVLGRAIRDVEAKTRRRKQWLATAVAAGLRTYTIMAGWRRPVR